MYISRWSNTPGEAAPGASHFSDGQLVAFKRVFQECGGGNYFPYIETEAQFMDAGKWAWAAGRRASSGSGQGSALGATASGGWM